MNHYSSTEKGVMMSFDSIQDRQVDRTFYDRTKYEVRVAQMRSNYVEMVNDLKDLAKKYNPEKIREIRSKNSRK